MTQGAKGCETMAEKIRLRLTTKTPAAPTARTQELLAALTEEAATRACRFHQGLPGYAVTPLAELKHLARRLGVGGFYVKDESFRFGLNAFKALGGSYAAALHLAELCGLPPEQATYAVLTSAPVREKLRRLGVTLVTATDGNHGRGVAWTAKQLGLRSVVLMPAGSAPERLQNILALGAEASITELNYDGAVRRARDYAAACGGVLVQDTAWEGYERLPLAIMQGYTTLALEAVLQLEQLGALPTHVFLQAGVGSLAGAVTGFLVNYYRRRGAALPVITIVEPEAADCLYRTAAADDGRLHFVTGKLDSMMAGLCCGEPCSLAWEILRCYAPHYVSMSDGAAALGMRLLGRPQGGDARVISGESGAAGVGCAAALLLEPSCALYRERLGLNASSVVLCLSTEGDTDRENYRRIMAEAAAAEAL